MITVADIFMPFSSPKASISLPFITNFCRFGILKGWFVPSGRVRITEFGGVTWKTVPSTVLIAVIVVGVTIVVIVRCSFMPGLRS